MFLQLDNDPEFQEFLELHKGNSKKATWGNDAVQPDQKPASSEQTQKDATGLKFEGNDSDSDNAETGADLFS